MVSLIHTVRDLDRLRQIVLVLTRHGFGEIMTRSGFGSLLPGKRPSVVPHIDLATRIRLVLQELGPTFVKLGQVISTRPDLIPADIIRELKKLQDEVPPVPFEELKPHIEAELGRQLSEVYEQFDEAALASASIGQAHCAKLRTANGAPPIDVVVKVQRPNIQKTIETDLDLLHILARAIERSVPESHIYSPNKLVDEFDRAIRAELDFVLEADNAARFTDNFEDVPSARFPTVYRDASSRRVITLERFEGHKVYAATENGFSGERIAKRSVQIFMKQIFEDGFFHADPHPGNVFILGDPEEPVIGFIDLGLVGRLTPRLRDLVVDLMVASVRRDYRAMADALYAIGRPTKKVDRHAFEAEVAALSDKYLGKQLADMELSAMIRDLVQGATKYGLEIPPDFLMMGKTLMTVEGVGKEIYPELDAFEEVKPFFLRMLKERYSPERITQDLMRNLVRFQGAANEMPYQVQEILDDLRQGRLKLQIQESSIEVGAERIGRRLFSGFVIAACLISGALLVSNQKDLLGGIAFGLGGLWLLAHTFAVFALARRRKTPRF